MKLNVNNLVKGKSSYTICTLFPNNICLKIFCLNLLCDVYYGIYDIDIFFLKKSQWWCIYKRGKIRRNASSNIEVPKLI